MPKKIKIKSKKQKGGLNKKQKGGGIDLNRKNETNYDDLIQYLYIGLLVVALLLGISVLMQHRKGPNKENIVYNDSRIHSSIKNSSIYKTIMQSNRFVVHNKNHCMFFNKMDFIRQLKGENIALCLFN